MNSEAYDGRTYNLNMYWWTNYAVFNELSGNICMFILEFSQMYLVQGQVT